MISVLIPVYNCEVTSLVNELSKQLNSINDIGEIIVFDDYSSPSFIELNRQISSLKNVSYKELDRNYGRTDIRKLLANAASYEWLLFLDCDSRIIHSNFLKDYIEAFKKGFDVYAGGRVYPVKPIECNKQLHWKYGMKRESARGNKSALHTNNFCIKKEIFLQLNFPGFLKSYGHEDTWMEIELNRLAKKILHIQNPVEHVHIEDTENFLNKTQLALQNLLLLTDVIDKNVIRKHSSLVRAYDRMKIFRLEFAVRFFYKLFSKGIARNLNSCEPSLFVFDFYRLYRFIELSGVKEKRKLLVYPPKIFL